MNRTNARGNRGSALLVSLGVLALLAIMGTTFVTMARMDSKLNSRYVDDVQCEMLARGLLEYCRGILADDLDRSMRIISNNPLTPQIAYKYANRDTGAAFVGGSGEDRLSCMNTDDNVRNTNEGLGDAYTRLGSPARWGVRLGVPVSRKFWVPMATDTRSFMNLWRSSLTANQGWQWNGQTGSWYCGGDEVCRMTGTITWKKVVQHPVLDGSGNPVWDPDKGTWAYTETIVVTQADTNGVGYDVWLNLCMNGIDDNGDGITDPYIGTPGFNPESWTWSSYYDTCSSFLTPGGPSPYFPGPGFTSEKGLPGGRFWRTAIRIGMPDNQWLDFNMLGNEEGNNFNTNPGLNNPGGLNNLDGSLLRGENTNKSGLTNYSAYTFGLDQTTIYPKHLGLMTLKGYVGEDPVPSLTAYNNTTLPVPYDSVCYSPMQISLREVLLNSWSVAGFSSGVAQKAVPSQAGFDLELGNWTDAVIASRYGGAYPHRAAGGDPRYRPGWRADGGSFFVIPSPENPQGTDSYFGAEEALEHATPSLMVDPSLSYPNISSNTGSRLFNIAYSVFNNAYNAVPMNNAKFHSLLSRSKLSTVSRDTILRGKIWFTEQHGDYRGTNSNLGAYSVPGNMRTPGEWRNISILKRVNLNMLGAVNTAWFGDGTTYLNWPANTQSSAIAKNRWIAKRNYEQDRCYYMLKGALLWYYQNYWVCPDLTQDVGGGKKADGTPWWIQVSLSQADANAKAAQGACQLIAALTDMIDRDQDETKYVAPDGSGAVGYGMERFPVITKVGMTVDTTKADASCLKYFRVELFNPCEKIPWLPDIRQDIDLSNYSIWVSTDNFVTHQAFPLPTLNAMQRGATGANFDTQYDTTMNPDHLCKKIGGSGVMYGGMTSSSRPRYLHVKIDGGLNLTLAQLRAGIQVALVKNVACVNGTVMIDRAANTTSSGGVISHANLLLATYNDGSLPLNTCKYFTGLYRRSDPLNALTYMCSAGKTPTQLSVVHHEDNPTGTPADNNTLANIGWIGYRNNYTSSWFNDASPTTANNGYNRYNSIGGSSPSDWGACAAMKDIKVPDTDMPSVGWIGEAFIYNYLNPLRDSAGNPLCITEVHDQGQDLSQTSRDMIDRRCKLNLFKPFGSSRNLPILDIFTCWDPSNDGIDNDGDGVVDNDTEVVVYGQLDANSTTTMLAEMLGVRAFTEMSGSNWTSRIFGGEADASKYSTQMPRSVKSYNAFNQREPLGNNANSGQDYAWPGPRDTIGDLIRSDHMAVHPGIVLGGSYPTMGPGPWSHPAAIPAWTWDTLDPDNYCGQKGVDDDGDGKVDECDERDAKFTWYANLFTTRNSVFTVEVISELTDMPYYPGRAMVHSAYKVDPNKIYSRQHLLAILDRSHALKVLPDGTCDFNAPVKVLVERWAQMNK